MASADHPARHRHIRSRRVLNIVLGLAGLAAAAVMAGLRYSLPWWLQVGLVVAVSLYLIVGSGPGSDK